MSRRTPPPRLGRHATAIFVLTALALALLIFAPAAGAAKQAVDFFGGQGSEGGQFSNAAGVAVNDSGAGGVPAGTLYATDAGGFDAGSQRGNRVERFARNDNGTLADTTDDTYEFISAWGAGVEKGGSDYEICTVAANCRAATGSGGNGTLAGDGSLSKPSGIAVDQDTGEVYVVDASSRRTADDNFRINVYSATGTFLRSFGWDVVQSGPDDAGTGYEVCKAGLDICKAGLQGSGIGQIGVGQNAQEGVAESIAVSQPDGNPATGAVFLADRGNRRVNTYNLDGSSPSSFGSAANFESQQPGGIAVDLRGIVYAANRLKGVLRYDTQNADGGGIGFLAPIAPGVNEEQKLTVSATAGQFRLSFGGQTTGDIAFDASAETVQAALRAVLSVTPQSVSVGGGPGAYTIEFAGALAALNVEQITASNGTTPLSGGSATVTTTTEGQAGVVFGVQQLAVDPDSDGAGPETDTLYTASVASGLIQQFGPLNPPGLTVPPSAEDARHNTNGVFSAPAGIATEPSTGRIYGSGLGQAGPGVYVLDNAGPPPTISLDSLSDVGAHNITAHATVNPNGPPNVSYHFEYSTDGITWDSTPAVVLGHQETPQAVEATIDPPPAGLEANTIYHVRISAAKRFATPVQSAELSATTAAAKPLVETVGSPVRSATTAQLQGRVDPNGSPSTYHFEYGAEGPCDANPCASTPDKAAGAGGLTELVAETVEGLEPGTTYHYRVVADNAAPGAAATGEDMTVTTRATDQPLSHGHFPGPPESDRAYEQVGLPESNGNPVKPTGSSFSDDGNRALYGIQGGTPISEEGTLFSFYFSQRGASGWQTKLITPPRDQLFGAEGRVLGSGSDLSWVLWDNLSADKTEQAIWRLSPGAAPQKLVESGPSLEIVPPDSSGAGTSADGRVVALALKGTATDPAYPAAGARENLYDVGFGGTSQLISLLPGNEVASCGANPPLSSPKAHWVSADGSQVVFSSRGDDCTTSPQLYLREVQAAQTKRISGSPISGPACGAGLIKATPGAVFFWTQARLTADDTSPSSCGTEDGDVYRYETATESLKCVTCLVAGLDADVVGGSEPGTAAEFISVSDDGSRLYFQSPARLLPGVPQGGKSIYRVDVAGGEVAYVGALGGASDEKIGFSALLAGIYISADGSQLLFHSQAPGLNALGGTENGGYTQFYLYDDKDRSLSCVSCPPDGSAPLGEVLINDGANPYLNAGRLAQNGIAAFSTPTPLVGADQNTPAGVEPQTPGIQLYGTELERGVDVYEWRDGRPLLITDGLIDWPITSAPAPVGISPSGRDVYFAAAAQYTPDALDAYARVYDARIGGGIDFPAAPKPCPLEVCQGTPKGAPEEQAPGTGAFSGAGNAAPKAAKKHKKRHHKRRAKKHASRHKANSNRRAPR
jgi:hypothetical protein